MSMNIENNEAWNTLFRCAGNGLKRELKQVGVPESKEMLKEAKETGHINGLMRAAVSAGIAEKSITTWGAASTARGLSPNNATAVMKTALNVVRHLIKTTSDDPNNPDPIKGWTLERAEAAFPTWFAANSNDPTDDEDDSDAFAEDDDATAFADDDEPEDPNGFETLIAADDDDGDATVEADGITWAELKPMLSEETVGRRAYLEQAHMLLKGDANLTTDPKKGPVYRVHINGKEDTRVPSKVITWEKFLIQAKHMGFNAAGVLAWKGKGGRDGWASDHWGVPVPPIDDDRQAHYEARDVVQRYDFGMCAVFAYIAVKSGVTSFDHDLGRYLATGVAERLRAYIVSVADADLDGWLLGAKRSGKGSSRVAVLADKYLL